MGSVCKFTCNAGYTRVGNATSSCKEGDNPNGLGWNNPVPVCRPGKLLLFPSEELFVIRLNDKFHRSRPQ